LRARLAGQGAPISVARYTATGSNRNSRPPPPGLGLLISLGFLSLFGAAGIAYGGHYERLRAQSGPVLDGVARAMGLGLSEIAVSGHQELRRDEIIAVAGIGATPSLLFIDPEAIKARLDALPLVARASVTKLYPDRLLLEIEERVPFGLWQRDGIVRVVAADGTEIDTFGDPRFLRLPHVVGEGANLRIAEYARLVASVPEFAGKVRAGTLVSGRRWTLTLQNGVQIKLPEIAPEAALERFAEFERSLELTERAVLSIDLRLEDRFGIRLTEEAAISRNEALEARLKPTGGRG
jgi:cell division protein FtsQ